MCHANPLAFHEMVSFSFLTTVLDNNLLTFRLDALVVLNVNEAKAWGTSIYSYVEASQCVSLLIDLRALGMRAICSIYNVGVQVGTACTGSTLKLPVHCDLAVGYVVATSGTEVRAIWCCLFSHNQHC